MLAVQVQYWTMMEQARHNKVSEETNWYVAKEQSRHNIETEKTNWFNAYEQQRHNLATEELGWFNGLEQQRHNKSTEAIQWYSAQQQAAIGWANVDINQQKVNNEWVLGQAHAKTEAYNADTNRINAETRQAEMNWDVYYRNQELDVKRQQAEAATWNAQVNQQNADTRTDELDLEKKKFKHQKVTDVWKISNEWANTVNDFIKTFKGTKSTSIRITGEG